MAAVVVIIEQFPLFHYYSINNELEGTTTLKVCFKS